MNQFLITTSRQPIYKQLVKRLDLRKWRQQTAELNDAQNYGGLGGFIIEGNPGIGKSELVIAVLIAQGYQQEHDLRMPTTKTNPFYMMPVSMVLEEKKALLLKAFNEGAVVVIDEINSSPMMEQWLNALLMGKTINSQRPQHPGFMVIGTQNPITMAGRRAVGTALEHRSIMVELAEYNQDEIQIILLAKGFSEQEASDLAQAYEAVLNAGKKKHLGHLLCFRDLLNFADDVLEGKKRCPDVFETKAQSATNYSLSEMSALLLFPSHTPQTPHSSSTTFNPK